MGMDVQDALDELGVEVVRPNEEGWVICLCPFHDDTRPSFAVAADNGNWVCYAGCGVGTLAQLAARLRGVDEYTAARWLAAFGGRAPEADELVAALKPRETAGPPVPPADLPEYERGRTHRLMRDRGFTPETLAAWGVGYNRGERAVVIPYVFGGETWGLIYKYVDPGADPPYYYVPTGLKKGRMLFGWDKLPPDPEEVVVTEGSLDAMWLHQCRYPGVALLGSSMSAAQAELLARRTRIVVLALDNDEAGRRGTRDAVRRLRARVTVKEAALPEGRKDVQECTRLELLKAVAEATDSLLLPRNGGGPGII